MDIDNSFAPEDAEYSENLDSSYGGEEDVSDYQSSDSESDYNEPAQTSSAGADFAQAVGILAGVVGAVANSGVVSGGQSEVSQGSGSSGGWCDGNGFVVSGGGTCGQ